MRWLLIMALLLPLAAQAEVYRWVDESGNVTYSDQPHQGAEKVQLPAITTYEPQPGEAGKTAPGGDETTAAATVGLQITSPKPDENIWSAPGIVDLIFQVDPELTKNQHIAILLDGKGDPINSPSPDFRISNLDRGTHTVTAWIVNAAGQRISQTVSVTFHLHRAAAPAEGPVPDAEHPYEPPTPEQQQQALEPPTTEQQQKALVPPTTEQQQQTLVPPTPEEQQKTLVPPTPEEQQKQYVPPTRQDQQNQYTPPPSFTPQ